MLVALRHAVPGPTGQRVATPAPDLRRAGASPLGRGLRQPPRRNVLCFEVPLPPRPVPRGATGTGTKALGSRGAATSLRSAPAGQAGARGRVGTQPSASLEEPLPQGTAGCEPALRAASPADGQRPLRTAPRQLLPLCLRHTFLLGDGYLDCRLFSQSPGAVRPPPPEATLPRT